MSPSSSCLRCQQVFAVESANGLCATCSKALDTSRDISSRTPSPDDRTASRSELVGATLSQQVANGAARTAWIGENGITGNWDGEIRLPNSPAGYDLFRYLGGGGMGDVYLAREHVAERTVAMKFLRGAPQSTAADRFLTEVRSLGRLDHPNIIRVISVDLDRADPHFTMEFAPGGTLSDWVKAKGPMPPMQAARIMAQVARAIEVAHGANILHRDLKPSNIVLGIDDIPKVTDFGLAKLTDRDDGVSMSTGPLGTPSFMPPEQISSKFGKVGPTSDVYGLGATLYHLLTGRPPFQGDTQHDIITQVQNAQPERISSFRPEVPGDLEGIVVKCLEKETRHRYPTALALAEDLERFLAGQVPIAPRQTWWRRMRRWVGRNPKALLLAAASFVFVIGVVLTALAMVPDHSPADPPPNPLDIMKRELVAGRQYVAIPATGDPAYSRWVLGAAKLSPSDAGDGACSFNTAGLSYLELVPDPTTNEYVVQADVRHLGVGDPNHAMVGIYLGYHEGAGSFSLDRLGYMEFEIPPIFGEQIPNRFDCTRVIVLRDQNGALDEFSYGLGGTSPFSPSIRKPGPWRTVRAVVGAAGVKLSWGPDADKQLPLRTWTAKELTASYRDHRESLKNAGRPVDLVPAVWSPRGAIGVWASHSEVAFRNVTVTPLPPFLPPDP